MAVHLAKASPVHPQSVTPRHHPYALRPSGGGATLEHRLILSLQRTAGNRAVARQLRSGTAGLLRLAGGDRHRHTRDAVIVQRLRYRHDKTAEEVNKTVEEVFESLLSGKRIKAEQRESALQALRELEAEYATIPLKDLPTWSSLQQALKKKLAGAQPVMPTHATFRKLVDDNQPITIKALKQYLSLPPDLERADIWKTAGRIRDETYGKSHEGATTRQVEAIIAKLNAGREAERKLTKDKEKVAIDEDSLQQKYLSAEERRAFATYREESKRTKVLDRAWGENEVIPPELLDKIFREEKHALQEREALQRRGIPTDALELDSQRAMERYVPRSALLLEKLKPLGSLAENAVRAVTKPAPTAGAAYLRGEIAHLLIDIAPRWGEIKPKGQGAIVDRIVMKSADIGDAKGTVGELTAVLYALREGKLINTGGEDKTLPGGLTIGGITTQDVDVRYVRDGGTRVYMEAKYDAKTLIGKYKGETKEDGSNPKAEATSPSSITILPAITRESGPDEKEKAPSKTTPERVEKVKSFQQQRYEAMLTKKSREGKPTGQEIKKRELSAIVANSHDWLLFFISGGDGKRVSKWLADANWTLVIKDQPIKPDRILALREIVPLYYHEVVEPKTHEKPEAWAERDSANFTPDRFYELAKDAVKSKDAVK